MQNKSEAVSTRHKVNKPKSVREFRKNTTKTKAANIQEGPMRGGWRL
jgi:hypothetical protein